MWVEVPSRASPHARVWLKRRDDHQMKGRTMSATSMRVGTKGRRLLPAGESTYWDTLRMLVTVLRGRDRVRLARVVLRKEELQRIQTWQPQEKL